MLEIEAHGKHGTFRGAKATGPHFKHFPLSLQSTHPLAWELQVIRLERSSHLINFRGKLLGCVLSREAVLKMKNEARKGPNNKGTTHNSQGDPDGQPQSPTTLPILV